MKDTSVNHNPDKPELCEFVLNAGVICNWCKYSAELLKISTEKIFKNILLQWATEESDLIEYSYYCTNSYGFKPLFMTFLDLHIRERQNKGNEVEERIALRNVRNDIDVRNNLL